MDLLFRGIHYHMVYNGELYNTEELRRLLVLDGHTFLGHSDTEVVLHAYAQWGTAVGAVQRYFLHSPSGRRSRERLFLARDRIGVKPLFYTIRDGQFLFASELKTLLAHPSVPAQVDAQGVAEVMLLGPGRTPGCGVFRGIREVEPGCCGYFDGQDMRLHRYWRLEDREHQDTLPQTLERVRALVSDAIRRQLVSDVPSVPSSPAGWIPASSPRSPPGRRPGRAGSSIPSLWTTRTTPSTSTPENSSPTAIRNSSRS